MNARFRVGIAGAGSIALGTAALLAQRGHQPMLWSPSGRGTDGLESGVSSHGAIELFFNPRIAKSAEELVAENQILLLALPAWGHKEVMDDLAPHIAQGQQVIISSHASMGALYLMRLLKTRGLSIPITAWGTTSVTGRREAGPVVRVNTVRSKIDLCTIPEDLSKDAMAICHQLFDDRFEPRAGLLAISLSNLNPQNHLGIALGNITRMERGEVWSQGQNVTPKVGRLLEMLDLERLAIAEKLGLKVKTIFEHFHLSFHVPVASISEINQQMHEEGNGGIGPATADSRYVTEDVPYGLQLTSLLGRLAERPAKLHEAGIEIFSAMYDVDFSKENNLLAALDLEKYGLQDLQRASLTGILN
ncbi:MAG: NAD/NADP octopine/nopaline dehydrogenase family protein [bacterium]